MPPLPAPRGAAGVALLDAEIHVLGGSDGSVSRAEHFVYSLESGGWTLAPPLAAARERHMSVAFDGRVLVLGGSRTGGGADATALSAVDVYDPLTQAWLALPPLLTARRSGTATRVRGQLVISGGAAAGPLVDTELYDPITGTSAPLPPALLGRSGAVSARIGNGVYVIGGAVGGSAEPTASVDVLHID